MVVRLGKCRGRDDGQQTHDGQKLLHLTSPVSSSVLIPFVEWKVDLGDTGEIDARFADATKIRFRKLNSCLWRTGVCDIHYFQQIELASYGRIMADTKKFESDFP
jgi:hypothetical protein